VRCALSFNGGRVPSVLTGGGGNVDDVRVPSGAPGRVPTARADVGRRPDFGVGPTGDWTLRNGAQRKLDDGRPGGAPIARLGDDDALASCSTVTPISRRTSVHQDSAANAVAKALYPRDSAVADG